MEARAINGSIFYTPGRGRNTLLHALPADRNSAIHVHSTSFSPNLLQTWTVTRVTSSEFADWALLNTRCEKYFSIYWLPAYLYLSCTFCLMSCSMSEEMSLSRYSDSCSVAFSKSFWFSCQTHTHTHTHRFHQGLHHQLLNCTIIINYLTNKEVLLAAPKQVHSFVAVLSQDNHLGLYQGKLLLSKPNLPLATIPDRAYPLFFLLLPPAPPPPPKKKIFQFLSPFLILAIASIFDTYYCIKICRGNKAICWCISCVCVCVLGGGGRESLF